MVRRVILAAVVTAALLQCAALVGIAWIVLARPSVPEASDQLSSNNWGLDASHCDNDSDQPRASGGGPDLGSIWGVLLNCSDGPRALAIHAATTDAPATSASRSTPLNELRDQVPALCDVDPDPLWPSPGNTEPGRLLAVVLKCVDGLRVVAPNAVATTATSLVSELRPANKAIELARLVRQDSYAKIDNFVTAVLALAITLGTVASVIALVLARRESLLKAELQATELRICSTVSSRSASWKGAASLTGLGSFLDSCRRSLSRIESFLNGQSSRELHLRLRLRRMCDDMGIGMVIYDERGRIRAMNRPARQALGIAQLSRRPQHIADLLPGDESAAITRLLNQLERTGSHTMAGRNFRRSMKKVSGELLTVHASEHLVGTQSAPRVLLTFEDRTAAVQTELALQQAIQEARTASEMKSRFLAMISHEIRTPLNGISGLSDLLKREAPSPHQIENLELLQESTHHLRSLLSDILDFSKIESGQLQLELQDFNIRPLVESTCNAMQGAARAKGLQIDIDLQLSVEYVTGDSTRLRQIITNLIDNAIKFTLEGGITVTCRTSMSSAGNNLVDVSFSIADTGIGMAPETVKKLFNPFTQANLSITRNFGGTGLGLSLCRLLCRRMDGDIMVTSTLGQGSTFSFHVRFPVATQLQLQAQLSRPKDNPLTLAQKELVGKKILVADDNSLNRRILKRWLDLQGATVQLAQDGQEALQATIDEQFDIVLMDISMPNMDGIMSTQKIREFELENRRRPVPIVGVTALSTSDDFAAGSSAGMNACISKPVDRETLMRVINRLLVAT